MKVYLLLGSLIAILFVYSLKQYGAKLKLQKEVAMVKSANADLNKTLSEVILKNKRDSEILQAKHEMDLNNTIKTQKALSYVKKTNDANVSKLFNDTILLLQ